MGFNDKIRLTLLVMGLFCVIFLCHCVSVFICVYDTISVQKFGFYSSF